MRRILLLVGAFVLVVGPASANAGTSQSNNTEQKEMLDKLEQDVLRSASPLSEQLETAINRWHEVVLVGKKREIQSREREIMSLISDDLRTYQQEVNRLEKSSVKQNEHSQTAVPVDRAREVKIREALRSKQLLLASIKASDSFNNKYRLLGEYLASTRQEDVPAQATLEDYYLNKPSQK